MKPGLAQLSRHLVEQTRRTRERLATEKLAIEAIRLQLDQAAQRGEDAVRIRLELDLRDTGAAKALNAWAGKEGLGITWEMRPHDLPDGRRITVYDPEIRWISVGIR